MDSQWDANLVECLFERLGSKLPHKTRATQDDLENDDILITTRETIVSLSISNITLVLEQAVQQLQELIPISSRPIEGHILQSQIYVLSLIAECCLANWDAIRSHKQSWSPHVIPEALDDDLVTTIFEVIKALLEPFPESYMLSSNVLLGSDATDFVRFLEPRSDELYAGLTEDASVDALRADLAKLDSSVKCLVEYVSASSWDAANECLRRIVYDLRIAPVPPPAANHQPVALTSDERLALVFFRALSFFWLDSTKVGTVLNELAGTYLHLKAPLKNTVAVITPLIITHWIDRFPEEFVQVHISHTKISGAIEMLFDMCQTENQRMRMSYAPMQAALLLLLPDVFEIVNTISQVKSSAMSKRVGLLDHLKKALRNKNQHACYCLVMMLRAGRHFDGDSDTSFSSFTLDIQDEVRDAVFRNFSPSSDGVFFDQDMITAAFVALAHLDLEGVADSLLDNCLRPNAPLKFKLAVVQACKYFANLPHPQHYHILYQVAASFIHTQLYAISCGNTSVILPDPSTSELPPETAMAATAQGILEFIQASNGLMLYQPLIIDSPETSLLKSFLLCLVSPNPVVRNLTSKVSCMLFDDSPEAKRHRNVPDGVAELHGISQWREEYWRRSANTLMAICNSLDVHTKQSRLQVLEQNLTARILILKEFPELGKLNDDIPEVVNAASQIETTLLLLLCAVDINVCQLVTNCIGLFLQEAILLLSTGESGYRTSMLRNQHVFHDLASKDFRFTGLVAFQKRTRGLLRRFECPTPGILRAWELALDRWVRISRDVSVSSLEHVADTTLAEWRNYSGLLASVGGVCIAERSGNLEGATVSGLRWIDRVSDGQEEPLLSRYLRLSIQLLACPNIRVREATREVLSSEVSPFLYQQLFAALEIELDVLFTGALAPVDRSTDREIIFAEQVSLLIRILVERLSTPTDVSAVASINLGVLTLNFAKFLEGVPDNPTTLRVKIKVCQLCEAVTQRKEHLNFRDDVRIRNQLLEHIFSWISRPRTPRSDVPLSTRHDETSRLQRDLDKACLKCLAELTYRLPLQPSSDGQSDAGAGELKSQLFQTYLTCFLQLLNHDTMDSRRPNFTMRDDGYSISDLSITILSNLLSANIDVGLKHSLNIGYHENTEIRTAFIKVLYNILIQGTEFSNMSDTVVSEKHGQLLDILTSDVSLAVALAVICPANEVDEMAISLLVIYEQRGRGYELIEALIRQEIEDTDSESEILRRNCVATKMLSIYAKWKGSSYLKTTLQKVVERLMLTSQELNLELDPTRVSSPEELQNNAAQLRIVAKVFVDDICASASNIPPSFRKICSIISTAVLPRFPDAKYTAVGAFIFLRFFCPAIVAPDVEGLVGEAPSKEMRRGLLLIAKVVQNLANNVLFGAKEPFMFPLNDFLTENIYRVTTFLREISVSSSSAQESSITYEWSEFGPCVSLHRFLYDHWDQFRQRLALQERRDQSRSPTDSQRARSPFVEPFRKLITNLGSPPMEITWNKPLLSANTPPSYAKFHSFMLRNSMRNPESFLNSRAIYEGGETKTKVPIVCIVLRYIDTDTADYDAIIYWFFKIVSRLWNSEFGLFIDATCYNTHINSPEDIFDKIEKLAPNELAASLGRIYVYNMNSTFRTCLRRLLRVSSRNRNSIFNATNVKYHILNGRYDFQEKFHLSQLHLPKETINTVNDTRFHFTSVTKLSRTREDTEVNITVGTSFIQVTSVRNQEVHASSRVSGIVNDIFRLNDVEDTMSNMTDPDDQTGFGLRTDHGKIVMQFRSPKVKDILDAIRTTKTKYGEENRFQKAVDRLVRPQDVPGTLLNLALTNMSSTDHTLRLTSYNLLSALCRAFKFTSADNLMSLQEISIPQNPADFVLRISTELAASEPQLTQDFLTEFFMGWDNFSEGQKPLSLAYMSPWLPGLRMHILTTEPDSEKARERVAAIIHRLVDIALKNPLLTYTMENTVWPKIKEDEILVETILEELTRTAIKLANPPVQSDKLEILASIAAAIGTITIRGKIIARLRKALNRSSMRSTRVLSDNSVWTEICVLLRFCLSLSFDCGVQAQLYLPDIFHIVTMLANTGEPEVRSMVHRLLINSLHSICTSFSINDSQQTRLLSALEYLDEPRSELFIPMTVTSNGGTSVATNTEPAVLSLNAIEALANLLIDICAISAPNLDVANTWRARWMSLVASTAFQVNPAIQPRAFTIMGCLAQGDVDDDLLYQVLVSLSSSIGRYCEDNIADLFVSIITALSKMMTKLPTSSRYGLQLFWLAISLIRFVPSGLFNHAAMFLEAFLTNIYLGESIPGPKLVNMLLQARSQLKDVCHKLDQSHGIEFTPDNFHFAICACLVRGLTDPTTRTITIRLLNVFLEVMEPLSDGIPPGPPAAFVPGSTQSPYATIMLSRCVVLEELNDRLWFPGTNTNTLDDDILRWRIKDLSTSNDKDLLLNACIELVDFQILDPPIQKRILQWLTQIAIQRPQVFLPIYSYVTTVLDDLLFHCQHPSTLQSAYELLQCLIKNPKYSSSYTRNLGVEPYQVLEDEGFAHIWECCSQSSNPDPNQDFASLLKELINFIIL